MRAVGILVFLISFFNVWDKFLIDAYTPFLNGTDEFWTQVNNAKTRLGSFNLLNYVSEAGYPIEEHNIVTDDGYKLILHRIPNGRGNSENVSRPVILCMHGILTTSASFIALGPDRSLPMQLADQNYDVWLGNNRGNTYSRDHLTLDPDKDNEFWEYSFEDLGTKDLPAIINYILNTTNRENLTYVGYSQGTTQMFVLLAMKPEYNEKILLVNALAPVAFMRNIPISIIKILADNLIILEVIIAKLGVTEILGESSLISAILYVLCNIDIGGIDVCSLLCFIVLGYDPKELDKADIESFMQTFPSGSSVRSFVHYGQEIVSGHFRQFDYGVIGNMDNYGDVTAPDFNISNIRAPIALFYGENDNLATSKDVEWFADQLENTVWRQKVAYKYFNHLDFLYAKDLNELLNFDVINLINVYNVKENLTTTSSISTETIISTTGKNCGTTVGVNYSFLLITMICFMLIINKIRIK